jgi:hypothetical protein
VGFPEPPGVILRIRQIRPVERAAAPLIDHNIELIQAALSVRDWKIRGPGPKITSVSSNISFISKSFPFFNAENRQRMFTTRVVG